MSNASIARAGLDCNYQWCVIFNDHSNRTGFPIYVSGNLFILTQDLFTQKKESFYTIDSYVSEQQNLL